VRHPWCPGRDFEDVDLLGGDCGDVSPPVAVVEEGRCIESGAEDGVQVEEVDCDDALGLVGEELSQGWAGTARSGSTPAEVGIFHTVEESTGGPSRASSPWIRLCPQRGFSLVRRTMGFLIAARGGGATDRCAA
jgi:hypothetical protein